MAARKSSRKKREGKRDTIINSAIEVLAEEGLDSATIEEIARRAGISKGLIYWYFKSKEELIKATALIALPHKLMIKELCKKHKNVRDLLSSLGRSYLEFYSNKNYKRFFLHAIASKHRLPYLNKMCKELCNDLLKLGEERMVELGCQRHYAEAAFRAFFGSLLCYLISADYTNIPPNDYVEKISEIIARGIS